MSTTSTPDELPQLDRADVARLSRENPEELAAAYRDGRLRDVLAGRDRCPTCGRTGTKQPG